MAARRPPEAVAHEAEFPGARWLSTRCTREVVVVGTRVENAIGALCRRHGLTHAAVNALAVIEGEGGPLLTSEVAARMHVTSGTVTALLDNLERKKFVVRSNDADDRRRVLVDITPEAQVVLDEVLPEIQQLARAIFAGVPLTRQQELLDILADVTEAVAAVPEEMPPPAARNRPPRVTRRRAGR